MNITTKFLILITCFATLPAHGMLSSTLKNVARKKAMIAAQDIEQKAQAAREAASAEDDCSICLDKLSNARKETECGHNTFHDTCLLRALQENRHCPLCRHLQSDQFLPSLQQAIEQREQQEIVERNRRETRLRILGLATAAGAGVLFGICLNKVAVHYPPTMRTGGMVLGNLAAVGCYTLAGIGGGLFAKFKGFGGNSHPSPLEYGGDCILACSVGSILVMLPNLLYNYRS